MKLKVLVIKGHPDSESFCSALADSYLAGASDKGAQVKQIDLSRASFEPSLRFGFRKRMELEEELKEAQELIRWADHLVFVYPNWWGAMPAVLKGFIDRAFLPGFAFKYRPNSPFWDKLLTGKSARIIITMDSPPWYNNWIYRRIGIRVMKQNILHFCGIKPVRVTQIGPIKGSSTEKRAGWLEKVGRLGNRLA